MVLIHKTKIWDINIVGKQSGHYIKVLRSDRGEEYASWEFNKLCED